MVALSGTSRTGPWRLARPGAVLVGQVDALHPGRTRASDGSIGDASHAARPSDHNPAPGPDSANWVTAVDITTVDDPNGTGAGPRYPWADDLVAAVIRDQRVAYVIDSGRIFTPGAGWAPYNGPDPHTNHVHVSTRMADVLDDRPWALPGAQTTKGNDDMTAADTENIKRIRQVTSRMGPVLAAVARDVAETKAQVAALTAAGADDANRTDVTAAVESAMADFDRKYGPVLAGLADDGES